LLRWHDGRRRRRHAPDFFVRLIDGKGVVVEWLIAGWQNRRHDGLRDPVSPGRTFTPNEKYASLVQAAGYIAVALSADDYIELLPASWRAINHYGVKIGRRTYDSNELNPLRRQPSGVQDKKNLWEVHRDPYDVCRVWIRNHHDGGWITLFWKHLNSMPTPFGELAWNHALAGLLGQGGNPTEDEIGQAAADLLDRAHRGPPSPQAATSVVGRRRPVATSGSPRGPGPPGRLCPPPLSPPFRAPRQLTTRLQRPKHQRTTSSRWGSSTRDRRQTRGGDRRRTTVLDLDLAAPDRGAATAPDNGRRLATLHHRHARATRPSSAGRGPAGLSHPADRRRDLHAAAGHQRRPPADPAQPARDQRPPAA
jgi:hypothetical protein